MQSVASALAEFEVFNSLQMFG